jgi:predicted DNA-binding protein YlxM (UPF0122 family)
LKKNDLISAKELAQLLRVVRTTIHYNVARGNLPKLLLYPRISKIERYMIKAEVAKALGLPNLDGELLTVPEAAEFLGISPASINKLCQHRHLSIPHYSLSVRNGSKPLFLKEELLAFREQQPLFLVKRANCSMNYALDYLVSVFHQVLASLPLSERDTDIMRGYFAEGLLIPEIAAKYDITGQRCYQIVQDAQTILNNRLKDLQTWSNSLLELSDDEAVINVEVVPAMPEEIIDLDDCPFSQRTRRCLQSVDIKNLNQLCKMRVKDLKKIWSMGKKSIDEVQIIMCHHGLKLKGT